MVYVGLTAVADDNVDRTGLSGGGYLLNIVMYGNSVATQPLSMWASTQSTVTLSSIQ
jgi:hypothetical protein